MDRFERIANRWLMMIILVTVFPNWKFLEVIVLAAFLAVLERAFELWRDRRKGRERRFPPFWGVQ
jgi:hypothetical protein